MAGLDSYIGSVDVFMAYKGPRGGGGERSTLAFGVCC